ncbi:O-antigen polysaccharide polymerase Wzy [Agrococcus lahaulensis]|nr:O-antigen polysaccharide polymerase Wzy [Agrococcus lahaulensis]
MALIKDARPHLGLRDFQLFAMIACVAVAVWASLDASRASLLGQATMLVLSTALLLVVVWRRDRRAGGAGFLYFALLGLFHFGLLLAVGLYGQAALIGQGDNSWVNAVRTADAVVLTTLGLASAGVGSFFADRLPRPRWGSGSSGDLLPLGPIGSVTAAVGAASMLSAVFSGGVNLLSAGYLDFLSSVEGNQSFSYGQLLFGVGLALMVANRGRTRLTALIAMGVFAVIALPIGLRGPVIFPAMVLLMIEARFQRVRILPFAVGGLGVLTAISLLRQTRLEGVGGILSGGWTRVHPVDGAAEMGYSLYPVVVVNEWMEGGSEPWYGATFVAPMLRFFEGLLGQSPPGLNDFRLFNVEVFARVGPIGGSPIAEGHRNLAVLGVVMVMVVLATILARLDALPDTRLGATLAAVVFLPLITTVRNSFAPTLVQILIGLAIVGLTALLAAARRERRL